MFKRAFSWCCYCPSADAPLWTESPFLLTCRISSIYPHSHLTAVTHPPAWSAYMDTMLMHFVSTSWIWSSLFLWGRGDVALFSMVVTEPGSCLRAKKGMNRWHLDDRKGKCTPQPPPSRMLMCQQSITRYIHLTIFFCWSGVCRKPHIPSLMYFPQFP